MSATTWERPADERAREQLRVAFVGQSVYFRQCTQELPAGGIDPHFIDFRAAAPEKPLLSRLHELDADAIVVFRPEIIPTGLFDTLRAVTIGYLTEPLPRANGRHHPDLAARLGWLEQVDAGNFDRIVSFDPLIADTAAQVLPVWRSVPIPVADSLFMNVRERPAEPRLLFVGRSTEHRERLLAPVKLRHPLVHIGHGLHGDALRDLLAHSDVQFNLHNNPYPTFENRVCIALAAGHLVISEPLSPDHGLVAGRDYLQVTTPKDLLVLADQLMLDPQAHRDVQISGRDRAEEFRASTVYPALLEDAIAEIAERGTSRRRVESLTSS